MNSEECRDETQADLDNMAYKWTQEWFLKFSINKFYGLNNKKYPLCINGKQLVESDFKRNLGKMFSTRLE